MNIKALLLSTSCATVIDIHSSSCGRTKSPAGWGFFQKWGMAKKGYTRYIFGQERRFSMYSVNSIVRVGSTPSQVFRKPQIRYFVVSGAKVHGCLCTSDFAVGA